MFAINSLVMKMFIFVGEKVCAYLHMSSKHLPPELFKFLYYDLLNDFKF